MNKQDTPYTIYLDILRADLLEDRTEYELDDLQSAYELSTEDASLLLDLIRNPDEYTADEQIVMCLDKTFEQHGLNQDKVRTIIGRHAPKLASYWQESQIDSGWDGWKPGELVGFFAGLYDFALYCQMSESPTAVALRQR